MITAKRFFIAMVGPIVFGLIDNGGLFLGMAAIENYLLSLGYGAKIAAGFGNTFSDALGAALGGSISLILYKKLGLEHVHNYTAEVLGIIVGCLIPVFVAMAIA